MERRKEGYESSSESSRPPLKRDLTKMIDNMGTTPTNDVRDNRAGQSNAPDETRRGNDERNEAGSEADWCQGCGTESRQCRCPCCQEPMSSAEDDTTSADAPPLQPDTNPRTDQERDESSSPSGLPPCRHQYQPCSRPHNEINYETVNRYHYNHIGLQRTCASRSETALSKFRNLFRSRRNESSSMNNLFQNIGSWYNNMVGRGECEQGRLCRECKQPNFPKDPALPQLYTARVKNTTGVTPERFVFNAVCGIPHTVNWTDQVNYCHEVRPKILRQQQAKEILNSYQGKVTKENITSRGNVCEFKPGYAPFHQPPERIDIYCFDHQNAGFFQTTDSPPPIHTELMIEKVDQYSTNFWAEIFGFVHVFVNFGMAFIMQLIKFLLCTIVRPLMVGTLQLFSDYFLKPLLTIVFNGLLQPMLIFLYNIATSFRDLCLPIARGIGFFLRELAQLVKAFRIVETKSSISNGPLSMPK